LNRYSPHLPWRPLVPPPSVDDHDACALYASVRKDATPSREPVQLALACPPHAIPHDRRAFAGLLLLQVARGERRHIHVQVDAIHEWT